MAGDRAHRSRRVGLGLRDQRPRRCCDDPGGDAAPTEDAEEQSTTEVPAEPTVEAPLQTAPEGTEGGGTEAPGESDGTPPDSEASEEFSAVNPGAS